jgi:hypothetical protein
VAIATGIPTARTALPCNHSSVILEDWRWFSISYVSDAYQNISTPLNSPTLHWKINRDRSRNILFHLFIQLAFGHFAGNWRISAH